MNRFTQHSGTVAPLYRPNIDTDQIIPKQFLKRIERTGYGEFLFYDWRFQPSGEPIVDFVLNDPQYASSSILIAGPNFGCGSSREHAPWSLIDHGFRVVIAPSFADIFFNNSLKNGLLPVILPEVAVSVLARLAEVEPARIVTVDLESQTVSDKDGEIGRFEIDQFRKHCLINGLDDIALTLALSDKIEAYENNLHGQPRYSCLSR